MQHDTMQQSFLPDRSITYSTASSFYPRDSTFEIPIPPKTGIPSVQFPSPDILLGNYSRPSTAQNGTSERTKRRAPSLSDPIQTHLLLQTALGDCSNYEMVSFEELESLKKEGGSLKARIEALRRKLALETKVCDAAKSLARLRSTPSSTTSSPKANRRSSTAAKETRDKANQEYVDAQRKCDQLARDLYALEQQAGQIQMRLLQHTAGILQTTHHGFSKNPNMPFIPGGRPDSPASMDDGYGTLMLNDNADYDGFLDNLSSKPHRRQPSRTLSREGAVDQREMLMYLANGLEDLNKRFVSVISRTNPRKAQQYARFPEVVDEAVNITFAQQLDHLSRAVEDIDVEQTNLHLESQALVEAEEQIAQLKAELQASQQESQARSNDTRQVSQLQAELQASIQENLALQNEHDKADDLIISQLDDVNNELHALLSKSSPGANIAQIPSEASTMVSLEYLGQQVTHIVNLVESSTAALNKSSQTDAVIQGLWSFILGAEEELRQRKRKEREALFAKKSAGDRVNSEDEVSSDEDDGLGEEYSIQAFNTKVQWLVSTSLYLKEKSGSLRRKVKAHRARADRSLENVPAVDEMMSQLDRTNELYATAKDELRDMESRFAQLQKSKEENEARVKALQDDMDKSMHAARDEASAATAALERKLEEARQRTATLEQDLAAAKQQREEDTTALQSLQARDNTDTKKNEAELAELHEEVVRLKTELTIAQAELDSAYGSRSQRAAELAAAANTEASKKLDEAMARNVELQALLSQLQSTSSDSGGREAELKRELGDTLQEFEELTKASVDQEREREELEQAIDRYRDRVEGLEAQIADDQVKWLGLMGLKEGGGEMGSTSPGSAAGGAAPQQTMSAMVLKNEFKKMMREARTESARQLRAEQDERRRLEGVIRNLKRSGGSPSGGTSGGGGGKLTYTMTA